MTLTVNGETIDPKDIEMEVARLKPEYDRHLRENNAEGGEEQLRQWSTENIIERVLLTQEARKTDITIPAEEVDTAFESVKDRIDEQPEAEVKKEITDQMKTMKYMNTITENIPAPGVDEVVAFHADNTAMFTKPEQVHASHIIKHLDGGQDREKALAEITKLSEQIKSGAAFEELATANSDCADNAGDLGCFPRGQMVQEFEDVVFAMKPGEVSGVFETAFGYHIAKLHEIQPEQLVPLTEVQDKIAMHLHETKKQKAVESFIDELKDKAEIVR